MKTFPLFLTMLFGMLSVGTQFSFAQSGSYPENARPSNGFIDFHDAVSYTDADTLSAAGITGTVRQTAGSRQTYVRIYNDAIRSEIAAAKNEKKPVHIDGRTPPSICNVASRARGGQIAPNTGGGTLNIRAWQNPTTINSSGRIAFNARVDGSLRNQGVFVADSLGISTIAIGCGGVGGSVNTGSGCGDPSPIGGTFTGFFTNQTVFTPDINDAGDVLFFCDVNGGSSSRGLFLYRAAGQQIVKVAAVGDSSPIGGTFNAVGPGSLNNNSKIVFLASRAGTNNSDIFLWNNGAVTKVAAVGDQAPGGGTFSLLGTEGFGYSDGKTIPGGPVPDINDADQICFRAIVSGGIAERGIIVRTDGVDQWYVKAAEPTPIGGTYLNMQAASINNAGQIAFLADYRPTPSTGSIGWFAGAPGSWRKVIVFLDSVDGGQCTGLAYSRNPMQTIDAAGNVLVWAEVSRTDHFMLGLADGNLIPVARGGQPSSIGGSIAEVDYWPAVNSNRGTLNINISGVSTSFSGATTGDFSTHMVFSRCLPDSVNSVYEPDRTPSGFYLAQNSPNPFNPTTTIEYHLPVPVFVKISIFDILGREIAILVNENKSTGKYRVTFDAGNLPAGAYFCRIEAGLFHATRKLVLLK